MQTIEEYRQKRQNYIPCPFQGYVGSEETIPAVRLTLSLVFELSVILFIPSVFELPNIDFNNLVEVAVKILDHKIYAKPDRTVYVT